ncbi:oxygen-dependent protoporphyrinogen oxidase [Kitasatospora kifunensis]|uniref:Oxygen-dependent protoporphyrinogen oxidase n=2 Tax=Kitasatospora kifunensis TaxID=58351 RepID=A0A7W7VYP9_KITKI|nr:oxygen-dependent protoporphyrinogen oxidase [Kitasatospora kifunensis]
MSMPRIAVIGAGIAGLHAATTLQGRGFDVTVLEKARQPGGRITTISLGGVPIDVGAEYVTNAHTHTTTALRRLGLEHQLRPVPLDIALYDHSTPQRVPLPAWFAGRHLGLPAKLGLARAYLTVLRHRRDLSFADMHRAHHLDTATVAEMFPNWAADTVEHLLHPMMRTFLFSSPHHTSRATMLCYLKLLLGLRSVRVLTGGLQQLPQRLAEQLPVRLGHEVREVTENEDGTYRLHVAHAQGRYELAADAVLCATTASTAARILTPLDATTRGFLATVPYASAAVLNCALDRTINSPARWVMNTSPADPDLAIMRIIPGTPEHAGDILTLWSPGGRAGSELCDLDDEQAFQRLAAQARQAGPAFDLRQAMRSRHVHRWPEALPQFPVGHLRRVHAMTRTLTGRLALAGDYLAGQNVEAAITSSIRAANQLTRTLRPRGNPA